MKAKYPIWDIETAANIAVAMHHGQVDKAGVAYIYHPTRVAENVMAHPKFMLLTGADKETAVMTAWLHDVLEDTTMTLGMLQDLGCPLKVCALVAMLTRYAHQLPEDYYAVIKGEPLALLVKECDIRDNTDPARLAKLDKVHQARLIAKYDNAKMALGLDFDKDPVR